MAIIKHSVGNIIGFRSEEEHVEPEPEEETGTDEDE